MGTRPSGSPATKSVGPSTGGEGGAKTLPDLLVVPPQRVEAIRRLATELLPGRNVVLSTHINADGDGCGSEAALAHLLTAAGMSPRIINPTPWPNGFAFLRGRDLTDQSAEGIAALAGVDVLIVVDISDIRRLGVLADAVRALDVPKLVIDHHVPGEEPPGSFIFSDTAACATGELVFDL